MMIARLAQNLLSFKVKRKVWLLSLLRTFMGISCIISEVKLSNSVQCAAVCAALFLPGQGGLTLMLVGAAAAGARVALGAVASYCRRHVMITAEIDSRDDAYRWVMHWLSQHPKLGKRSTIVSVTTNFSCFGTAIAQQPLVPAAGSVAAGTTAGNDGSSSSSQDSIIEQGPPVAYLPAPGDHFLTYRGKLMMISRKRTAGNPQLAANARWGQRP
jgi:hypothetical protein